MGKIQDSINTFVENENNLRKKGILSERYQGGKFSSNVPYVLYDSGWVPKAGDVANNYVSDSNKYIPIKYFATLRSPLLDIPEKLLPFVESAVIYKTPNNETVGAGHVLSGNTRMMNKIVIYVDDVNLEDLSGNKLRRWLWEWTFLFKNAHVTIPTQFIGDGLPTSISEKMKIYGINYGDTAVESDPLLAGGLHYARSKYFIPVGIFRKVNSNQTLTPISVSFPRSILERNRTSDYKVKIDLWFPNAPETTPYYTNVESRLPTQFEHINYKIINNGEDYLQCYNSAEPYLPVDRMISGHINQPYVISSDISSGALPGQIKSTLELDEFEIDDTYYQSSFKTFIERSIEDNNSKPLYSVTSSGFLYFAKRISGTKTMDEGGGDEYVYDLDSSGYTKTTNTLVSTPVEYSTAIPDDIFVRQIVTIKNPFSWEEMRRYTK